MSGLPILGQGWTMWPLLSTGGSTLLSTGGNVASAEYNVASAERTGGRERVPAGGRSEEHLWPSVAARLPRPAAVAA